MRGETNADAGTPVCDHHHRFKTAGFTTAADDAGHWHTTRPDGSSINGPPDG